MEGRAQTYKQTYNRIIFDEQDDAIRRRTMESLHNRRRLAGRQPARTNAATSATGKRTAAGTKKKAATSGRRRLAVLLILSALLLFAGVSIFSGLLPSGASVVEANQQLSDRQYKVIRIERGDSLWSIAKENMNPGFDDIYDYIHEVRRCNQLSTDQITAGNYLMIPYYE